jgi:hypothetical protein
LKFREGIHFAFTVTARRFGGNHHDFGFSPRERSFVDFNVVSNGCPVTRQVVEIVYRGRAFAL